MALKHQVKQFDYLAACQYEDTPINLEQHKHNKVYPHP